MTGVRKPESLLNEETIGGRERKKGRVFVIRVVDDEPGLVEVPRVVFGSEAARVDGEEVVVGWCHGKWPRAVRSFFFFFIDEGGSKEGAYGGGGIAIS